MLTFPQGSRHDSSRYITTRQVGEATVTLINDGTLRWNPQLLAPADEVRAATPEAEADGTLSLGFFVAHIGLGDASILVDTATTIRRRSSRASIPSSPVRPACKPGWRASASDRRRSPTSSSPTRTAIISSPRRSSATANGAGLPQRALRDRTRRLGGQSAARSG
ncbi:MAG: hypothetical protein U0232_11265 [Thermomicrobiales bacterium]